MTYEHLDERLVSAGEVVTPGELIAYSGCTGTTCGGPHLHFQRATAEPTFSSSDRDLALFVPPIDNNIKLIDDDICDDPGETPPCDGKGPGYKSSNAGVGYASGDTRTSAFQSFENLYSDLGGWDPLGRPYGYSVLWTPCRWKRDAPTHWRYQCTSGAYDGYVQTFVDQTTNTLRAFARRAGGPGPFLLAEPMLYIYTEEHLDKDFVHWIGYPDSENIAYTGLDSALPYYYQSYENGEIRYWPSGCMISVYIGNPPPRSQFAGGTKDIMACSVNDVHFLPQPVMEQPG